MKKKILIVVPALGTGGGEKLAVDLAINLDRDKFDVAIVSLFPQREMLFERFVEKSNIPIFYLDKRLGFDISIVFKTFKMIKNYRPDAIHTHLRVVPYILLPIVLYRIKGRFHTVHSIASEEAQGLLKFIMRCAYKYFGFVPVAICDYVKQTIHIEYKINNNNIPCIYNGIDITKFYKNSHAGNEIISFITTGRLQDVKNHKLMIDAFAEVYKQHKNVSLTILGDGELRKDIERQVIQYELTDKVFLKGIVENVAGELNRADVYIMSSNYEGLPLSVLEAMACGLPVITTKAGGVVDIVINNKNGLLVEVGNQKELSSAMCKLIDDIELRKEMGKRSQEYSKKYSISECAKKYEQLYLEKL